MENDNDLTIPLLMQEVERLKRALRLISEQEDTDLMLDPTWAKRIALVTLKEVS